MPMTCPVTFHVDDMTCGHCASTIARAVRAADAHAGLEIDMQGRRVRIRPTEADEAELLAAIAEVGYHPVPVADGAASGGRCR